MDTGRYWLRSMVMVTILIGYHSANCEQRFAMEPQDQRAVIGSRVTLPCRIEGKTGELQWTKDGFGLGTHRDLPGFDRYRMIGSDDEGDYSLEIFPVNLDDDGSYQCQVGPGADGSLEARSRTASLTVLVAPEPPKIIQGESLLTTEDREIELECQSYGGKPASEITWIDGLGTVMNKHNVENINEKLSDNKRFNTRSILKLIPKKEHHNTIFTCQAHNPADRTYKTAKLKLEVKYAPKVTVTIDGGAQRLVEGSDVRFRCSADANPPDVKYRWYINDRLTDLDATTELVLTNITRAEHDSIVKCEVHNGVGKSEESETLDITFGPKFKHRPQSVQADKGSTVTLTCDVEGNPPPDIIWIHEVTDRMVGRSMNYSVVVSPETAGRYYCKASVIGFHEIGAEATIYMKGHPTIISHHNQFGVVGDNVRLECTAYAIPPPTKVTWTFKGDDIANDKSNDYSVLEDQLSEGIKSTLVIRESRQDHFGTYNCTVINAYGFDTIEITLKAQKNFPLLVILSGVIVGIIIIIVIITCIVVCQRKVKKPPASAFPGEQTDVEKQCKESDRSSNISDIKLELRTGSSVSNVHCDVLDYNCGVIGNGGGGSTGGGGGSETGSDSIVTRIGVPLAGPVVLPSDHHPRYSTTPHSHRFSSSDYPDPVFPPKNDGSNNNGYVPYVDYTRDYNPPPPPTTTIDPRYSAAYGNPYLRTGTGNGPSLPPPPPYASLLSSRTNGVLPHQRAVVVPPNAPSPTSSNQYIMSGPQQRAASLATHV